MFHVSQLDYENIKKNSVDKITFQLQFKHNSNSEIYKVKGIFDSEIYTKKSLECYLSDIYYVMFSKNHSKKKHI